MIDFLRGSVRRMAADHAVIDVGGVGIRVEASPGTLARLRSGESHELPTALVIREDSWTVYGFADVDEREVFDLVQTVSGIGPRTAQALVATLSPNGLRRAVSESDETALMAVPGIGRKGAQRLLLELTDRIGPAIGSQPGGDLGARGRAAGIGAQVQEGLVALGWTAREADEAIRSVLARLGSEPDDSDPGALLKAALRELNRS